MTITNITEKEFETLCKKQTGKKEIHNGTVVRTNLCIYLEEKPKHTIESFVINNSQENILCGNVGNSGIDILGIARNKIKAGQKVTLVTVPYKMDDDSSYIKKVVGVIAIKNCSTECFYKINN